MVITASKIKGCAIDDEDDAEDHPNTLDDEDDLYDEREMSPRTNIDLSCETNGYSTFEQGTNKYYVTSQSNLQYFKYSRWLSKTIIHLIFEQKYSVA